MSALPTIVGHEAQRQLLADGLDRDRLHHAWLFEGPAGVGKHTIATWLAQRANCEGPDPHPCGRCGPCTQIANGTHPDVLEVAPDPDKATQIIPVSAVREVVRTAGFHRFSARKRFVIVDPAEALQAAAANALLKTLEEPPEGTHFVLICTRASALLPTIRSRCQRLGFGTLDDDTLTDWLTARGVDDAATLARHAFGAPGAALALADGGLDTRLQRRTVLLQTLAGDLETIMALAEKRGRGARKDWVPEVEGLLDLLEELLADTVVTASGADAPRTHDDLGPLLDRWADALWPDGITRIHAALRDARARLGANVGGQTVLEALLPVVKRELGRAAKGA